MLNIGFIDPAGDLSNVLLPLTGALPRGGKELCTGHNGKPGPIGGQVMHWHWLTSLRHALRSMQRHFEKEAWDWFASHALICTEQVFDISDWFLTLLCPLTLLMSPIKPMI